jgi:hypothetical protein
MSKNQLMFLRSARWCLLCWYSSTINNINNAEMEVIISRWFTLPHDSSSSGTVPVENRLAKLLFMACLLGDYRGEPQAVTTRGDTDGTVLGRRRVQVSNLCLEEYSARMRLGPQL